MNWLKVIVWIPLLAFVIALWLAIGLAPHLLTTWFPNHGVTLGTTPDSGAGIIGDMFGVANALFSALAFFGVVITLILQMHELRQNREEYEAMVAAQQDSADTALLVAKFNTFQASISMMASLIEKYENMSMKDFIAVRNNLWQSTRVVSSMIMASRWDEVEIPEIKHFRDDELILSVVDLSEYAELIAKGELWPSPNDDKNWPEHIRIRRILLNEAKKTLSKLSEYIESSNNDCPFLVNLQSAAVSMRNALEQSLKRFDPDINDEDIYKKFLSGDVPTWTSGSIWGSATGSKKAFIDNFRNSSIAWAHRAAIENTTNPPPHTETASIS